MRKPIAVAAAVTAWTLLTAGSCATTAGPVEVQRLDVPVAVPCAGPAPAKPDLVDKAEALRAAEGLFAKTRLLLAGRAQRDAYIAQLEASRAGCD